MIVDSGTTKTVAGAKWMDTYMDSLPEEDNNEVKEEEGDRYFRFGNGLIVNFEDEAVLTTKTFGIFPLETTFKGHLALPLKEEELLDDEIFLMDGCEKEKKKKKKLEKSTKFLLIHFQRF